MRRLAVAWVAAFAFPAAVQAQEAASMPGMVMPAPSDVHQAAPLDAVGDVPAAVAPSDHYADRIFGAGAMMSSRMALKDAHGGMSLSMAGFDLLEYQIRNGRDGYRWEGSAWFGGDIDRLVVKSEGEGEVRGGVESAEVQGLYSHALDPYWNLQAGFRFDPAPGRNTGYAVLGVEGLAPYWFDLGGAIFLSNRGDLLARLEGRVDQRVTSRIALEPRVELNFAAQDVRASRTGAGLSSAELGARLFYRLSGRVRPYVGYSWDRKIGRTARYFAEAGDPRTERSVVVGTALMF